MVRKSSFIVGIISSMFLFLLPFAFAATVSHNTSEIIPNVTGIYNFGGNIELNRSGEIYINLKNTESGGRQWTLVSADSDGGIGKGNFSIYDRTAWASRLIIDSNGNVGIGTTEPGQKLTVAGTIESTSGGFKFPDGSLQTSRGNIPTNKQIFNTSGTLLSLPA